MLVSRLGKDCPTDIMARGHVVETSGVIHPMSLTPQIHRMADSDARSLGEHWACAGDPDGRGLGSPPLVQRPASVLMDTSSIVRRHSCASARGHWDSGISCFCVRDNIRHDDAE